MEQLHDKLMKKQAAGEIDTFFSLSSLDFQKLGIILKHIGIYMSTKKKMRAVLEYSPKKERYYLSIKFDGCGIPEEIFAIEKAELDHRANKK